MSNTTNEDSAYVVEPRDNAFAVVSPSGMTIMECTDEHSANHYAELLTRAYRIGFKAGIRAGRREE